MALLTFLDLSTAHLTASDIPLIESEDLSIDTMSYSHGWIVSTATLIDLDVREENLAELREEGMSEFFLAAATAAAEQGAWLLRFDADADIDESLPVGGYGMID